MDVDEKMYILFYDNDQKDGMPLIGIFDFSGPVNEEDVRETIAAAFTQWKPELDCPPVRYAADAVCGAYGGSVEFVEAVLISSFPPEEHEKCAECGRTLDDKSDRTMPCTYNLGFSDETTVCHVCMDYMFEHIELTSCECCGVYFTYNHLIPNKDHDDIEEICPYCGGIWSD